MRSETAPHELPDSQAHGGLLPIMLPGVLWSLDACKHLQHEARQHVVLKISKAEATATNAMDQRKSRLTASVNLFFRYAGI